ncbi:MULTISPECIES: metallophosphoesterase family protein [unclassified Sphingomonas]|uniref:metallophosphoesterase family protein n=1 Tax=unclassified Sphingomonas TaxID=196159 RepID=UPI0006FCC861|nr:MULTISPECIES: metallophosphoesterase [unclassified Sphingomonas]KQM66696.1 metallophosphoesterase [Sphingomonas sp. Leaf16]KQN17645.1 metallophosphoesterase [Sphingomonas sp. Leaf29]KQN23509.1 metallophosphoesterase [Sphingomonas sp. Leaf32]
MIRLFHVSDVHFGAEDKAALAWFGEAVRREQPDAIIMTGDLTMRARTAEFEAAAIWLENLGRPVTVEVGNHDLPLYNLFARFVRPYKRYKRLERMIERPLEIDGVAIVPLKTTARFQFRWDWSKGYVSDGALARTLRLIQRVPKNNLIFIAAHHPLIDVGTKSSGETRGGAVALDAVVAAGAHAVLSGHVHDPFDIPYQTAGGQLRMVGAGTLSTRTRDDPPSFNEIRIENGRFETIARKMGVADEAVTATA